jgi:hypothetical protein
MGLYSSTSGTGSCSSKVTSEGGGACGVLVVSSFDLRSGCWDHLHGERLKQLW